MSSLLGQLSLKGRALRLLGGREHSRTELERKLTSHEEAPGQLAKVLDELQAKGFLSDERVAESVINRRAAKLGTGRIRQELKAKGLDDELVAGAVHRLRVTEFERAREVWGKKFGGLPASPAEKGRQARFLAVRGFSAEVVGRILSARDGDDGGCTPG